MQRFCFAVLILFALGTPSPGAEDEVLLHFRGGSDGGEPNSRLERAGPGVFYGTTRNGFRGGTIFELRHSETGGWIKKTLYSFPRDGKRGSPSGGLVLGKDGSLYGVTEEGGRHKRGTVYRLHSSANSASWRQTILHNFNSDDGAEPVGRLVIDKAGRLYGMTRLGGTFDTGTIFSIRPSNKSSPRWEFETLHSFDGGDGGSYPEAGLTLSKEGILYGTTSSGGSRFCFSLGCGVFFQLKKTRQGWKFSILHKFEDGPTGAKNPYAPLTIGPDHSLYGTSHDGGRHNGGTIFQLLPPTRTDKWSSQVLYHFRIQKDGFSPSSQLVLKNGKLYGSTTDSFTTISPCLGDAFSACGVIFELAPPTDGQTKWSFTLLHIFTDGSDGSYPFGGLNFGGDGWFYGTAAYGGSRNEGTIFRIKP